MEESWMAERDEEYKHRRDDDPEGEFVETFRRADGGLSMARRFIEVIVTLIAFGITIGVNYAQSSATRDAFADFKTEIRGRLDQIGHDASAANNDVRDLRSQVQQLKDQLKERADQQSMTDSRIIVLEKSYSRLEGRLSK